MPQKTFYLRDYRPLDYLCGTVSLRFELDEPLTTVRSRLRIRRNGDHRRPLMLDGDGITPAAIFLDGRPLPTGRYTLSETALTIDEPPDACVIEIETQLRPQDNTALSGLYRSGNTVCTQCEAEGFRRITFFPDRPDVLARFTTTVSAAQADYPFLLSNGNLVESGHSRNGRHWATWHDPYPKPCYLFALVAGDFGVVEDRYVSTEGRAVELCIYVEHHNVEKCDHAMASLKKAMAWDERTYGRRYELERYMIVAIDDFNMGAMENKGLNIFNTKYVLAKSETATDEDFDNIESVIGHEYFHNWSGNRVTCRDWFQLSLKEGFTVFREQQFSADMGSAGVKRIRDVNLLRTQQFREDAGAMAHPVRPDSYQEINNFYTVTVYNKGAEVIRMLYTLLGDTGFRRGTDLYFSRHDGQAVTVDDFLDAMSDANDVDLSQFRLWYTQAGTPVLKVSETYHPDDETFELVIDQSCPNTPGQPHKDPFHIPVSVALLDDQGRPYPFTLRGDGHAARTTALLDLGRARERFVFVGIPRRPVVSLLRGFSAPVKLDFPREDRILYFLMQYDEDPFCRWEATQQIGIRVLTDLIRNGGDVADEFIAAFARNLNADGLDPAVSAELLSLPTEIYVSDFFNPIDPEAVHRAVRRLRHTLARRLTDDFLSAYRRHDRAARAARGSVAAGHRAMKNQCLSYLAELEDAPVFELLRAQLDLATNMTDSVAALSALSNTNSPFREYAFKTFYDKWRGEPLVIDKWFSVQALSQSTDTPQRVAELSRHPAFNIYNPNRVQSLLGAFAHRNFAGFHTRDGAGYSLIADYVVKLDRINPQVAARLLKAFDGWRRFVPPLADKMRAAIEMAVRAPNCSRDVAEIANKSLNNNE